MTTTPTSSLTCAERLWLAAALRGAVAGGARAITTTSTANPSPGPGPRCPSIRQRARPAPANDSAASCRRRGPSARIRAAVCFRHGIEFPPIAAGGLTLLHPA
jgi:hypothetical protein